MRGRRITADAAEGGQDRRRGEQPAARGAEHRARRRRQRRLVAGELGQGPLGDDLDQHVEHRDRGDRDEQRDRQVAARIERLLGRHARILEAAVREHQQQRGLAQRSELGQRKCDAGRIDEEQPTR
jgi:hypothetical protein